MAAEREPASALRWLVGAAGFVVVVAGLRAAAALILPLLVAIFIAVVSFPLVAWLVRLGVPRAGAVVCTLLGSVAVLAGLIVLVSASVNDFTEALPRYQVRLQILAGSTLEWLDQHGIVVPRTVFLELVNPAAVLEFVRAGIVAAMAVVSNLFVVLLTLVFVLFEALHLPGKLQAALGRQGAQMQRILGITGEIQHYLALKTLVSLATGLLAGGWLAIVGVDFVVLWAVVTFALNYVPNLGSLLAALPPILLALVQLGPFRAAAVAVGYLVINLVIGNFVEPYLMGRRLGMSTFVVFLSLMFWGWVWGPVGMLLSVPLTMMVKILLENSEDLRWVAVLLDGSPPPPR